MASEVSLLDLPDGPRRDGYRGAPRVWLREYTRCEACGEAVPRCCMASHRGGGEGGCDAVTAKKFPALARMGREEREALRRERFPWKYRTGA